MRFILAPLALAVIFACSDNSRPGEGQPDATSSTNPDAAAQEDAATAPDATESDAAEPADAGSEDATPGDAGATGPTFSGDIFPMFESIGCSRVGCHGSLRAQGGAVVYLPDSRTAYTDLFERPSIREANLLVRPGDPEASVLYTHGRDANIPAGDLTVEGLALIGAWITAGAPYGDEVPITEVPQPATCTLADHPGTPPLPDACLPRCTSETWDGIVACRVSPDVAACQDAVIAADTSTVVQLDFGPDLGFLPLDCGTCLDLQTETCFVDHCLVEYLAATRCRILDPSPNGCAAEVNRVFQCASGSSAFRSCQSMRDFLCVGP